MHQDPLLVWSFDHICIIDWPFEINCFEFFLSKGNIFVHAGKYQLFGEHYRLFSHSFTRISKIVLEIKMCFSGNTVECHFDLCNFRQLHSKTSRFIKKNNVFLSTCTFHSLSKIHCHKTTPEIPAWTMLYEFKGIFVIHVGSLIFKTIHRILSIHSGDRHCQYGILFCIDGDQ